MVEQLQVALGLKEAVRRWCQCQPPQCSKQKAGGFAVTFLQQLLLLGSLEGAEAPPLPPRLLLDEGGDVPQERKTSFPAEEAALLFTPHSRNASNPRSSSCLHKVLQLGVVGSGQVGCHVRSCPAVAQAAISSDSTTEPTVVPQRQGMPLRQSLAYGGPVQQEGLNAGAAGTAGHQLVSSSDKTTAESLESSSPSPGVISASAAVAGAEAMEQQRGLQNQRQPQLRQQRPGAVGKPSKEKGTKRRPEQRVPLQGALRTTSLSSVVAAPTAALGPLLQIVGGPVARAEGPPQKRQAVARSRGDTEAGVRSSSSSSRSKPIGGGATYKTAPAARGCSAGRRQGSSCRLSPNAKVSPPTPKQGQENGGIQESATDIEATEHCAAAAAVAAARCSSSSSGADAAVSAFAAEWLRGCQQRLEATGAKAREESAAGSSSRGPGGQRDSPSHYSSSVASLKSHEELQLQQTKRQLKQELRGYNAAFAAHFGRQPLKQDKEPLRPVYMHYQRIKQRLEQHLVAAERNRSAGSATTTIETATATVEAATTTAATAESSSGAAEISSAATSARRYTTHSSSNLTATSPTGAMKRLRRQRSSLRSLEAVSPKSGHRGGPTPGVPRSPGMAKEKQTTTKPSAFERQQQMMRRREEMALRLHQLQRERRLLGDKLAAYHLRFKQEHGRPLRLKADIAPVHEEYKLFVEITKQIDALAFALQRQTL
ncbi:hypothetical protein, conserved [Eimeria brunetti]|uniref:FAM13A-like domain-containing protein n=1 Tax=Eimeria brunetti TaxID=51314 RepID=U6LVA6_9EIME|nr:hypothetical protein, conserved [Eimeria brunetti]